MADHGKQTTDKVGRFFDVYAQDFDDIYGTSQSLLSRVLNPLFRKSMRIRYEKTLLYSQPIKGKTVLDIGCGPGHYSIAFALRGAKQVLGIDLSEKMIRLARARSDKLPGPNPCTFKTGDFLTIPFEGKSFDISVVMGVMDYIRHPQSMIEKVLKETRQKVFFSFPAAGGLLAFQRRIRYLNRCPLFFYNHRELVSIFDRISPGAYRIEKIKRDFFVSVDMTE